MASPIENLKAFKRTQPRDKAPDAREFVQAQSDLERSIDSIIAALRESVLDTVLIKDVDLTVAVDNQVAHGLGQPPTSWFIAKPTVAVQVYENTASTADLDVYLPLLTTVTCTVDLVLIR